MKIDLISKDYKLTNSNLSPNFKLISVIELYFFALSIGYEGVLFVIHTDRSDIGR